MAEFSLTLPFASKLGSRRDDSCPVWRAFSAGRFFDAIPRPCGLNPRLKSLQRFAPYSPFRPFAVSPIRPSALYTPSV
jgi:hypothetical protein